MVYNKDKSKAINGMKGVIKMKETIFKKGSWVIEYVQFDMGNKYKVYDKGNKFFTIVSFKTLGEALKYFDNIKV